MSVEAAKPKAKAIARAAIVGDEEILVLREQLEDLRQQNRSLEIENTKLAMWKKRRVCKSGSGLPSCWCYTLLLIKSLKFLSLAFLGVDENLSCSNLSVLKEEARRNKLQVGGTKAQLLMRLVEAGVINPTWDN